MIEFSKEKPIYSQITDYCLDRIRTGQWIPEGRIPSIKELSAELCVNARTVMKSYDEMESRGIIFQKRGMGYFVDREASKNVYEFLKDDFLKNVIPMVARKMAELGLTTEEVIARLESTFIADKNLNS